MEKLTRREREIVEEAVGDMFEKFDKLQLLIGNIWEEHFSAPTQSAIYPGEAEVIGEILYLIESDMFDTIREFYMMVGRKDFRGVDCFLEMAGQARQTFTVNDLTDRACSVPLAEWAARKKALEEIAGLPDDKAIPKLRALINGEEN